MSLNAELRAAFQKFSIPLLVVLFLGAPSCGEILGGSFTPVRRPADVERFFGHPALICPALMLSLCGASHLLAAAPAVITYIGDVAPFSLRIAVNLMAFREAW